jgi:hypothetical protein
MSPNSREVEVLKNAGYLSGRMQVGPPAAVSDIDPCKLIRAVLHRRRDFLRQLAANHIDDASHRRAGMKGDVQIGSVWEK